MKSQPFVLAKPLECGMSLSIALAPGGDAAKGLKRVAAGYDLDWGTIGIGEPLTLALGKKVTGMSPGQGFAACLVTAVLVATASLHAVPVSTTHVSVGSLAGMGAAAHRAHWRKVGEILLAWVSTAPCGAALAALAYAVIRVL